MRAQRTGSRALIEVRALCAVRFPMSGARLRARRLECGMTLRELASKIGMNKRFLGDIERGAVTTTWETLHRVMSVLWDPALADRVLQEGRIVERYLPTPSGQHGAAPDAFGHEAGPDE